MPSLTFCSTVIDQLCLMYAIINSLFYCDRPVDVCHHEHSVLLWWISWCMPSLTFCPIMMDQLMYAIINILSYWRPAANHDAARIQKKKLCMPHLLPRPLPFRSFHFSFFLDHPLPICLTLPRCTPMPSSLLPPQIQGYFVSRMLQQKHLASVLSLTVPQSHGFLSLLTSTTFSPVTRSKLR